MIAFVQYTLMAFGGLLIFLAATGIGWPLLEDSLIKAHNQRVVRRELWQAAKQQTQQLQRFVLVASATSLSRRLVLQEKGRNGNIKLTEIASFVPRAWGKRLLKLLRASSFNEGAVAVQPWEDE